MTTKVFDTLPDDAKMIRRQVFVDEQGFYGEFDDADGISLHIVAYDGGKPVGTARLFYNTELSEYVAGRVAVVKSHRRRGVGRAVMERLEKQAKALGAARCVLHSQLQAVAFYESVGYTRFGEIGYEQDCPHIWMKKDFN